MKRRINALLDWVTWLVLGNKRIDHGPMYVCVMCALFCVALSMMYIGPVPNSAISTLSPYTQSVLSLCMFVGSAICLYGAMLGSFVDPVYNAKRLYRQMRRRPPPPVVDLRRPYWLALAGLPAVIISLTTYSWVIITETTNWPSAFGNALAVFIALASFLHGLRFQMEIRRINANLPRLIAEKLERDGEH